MDPAERPLVVQADRTVLLEVRHPRYAEARDRLALFAELEKSPEYVHTYRITALSIWNACASGLGEKDILDFLDGASRYEVSPNVRREVRDAISRYGLLRLERQGGELLLTCEDSSLLAEIAANAEVREHLTDREEPGRVGVREDARGFLKEVLIRLGYPVEDLAGYVDGAGLEVALREKLASGDPFVLRPYQREAIEAFYAAGSARGGSGVVVLPCGAGKTIVGMGVMEKLQTHTLILTTNTVAVRQWMEELHQKTWIPAGRIGEYTGETKSVRPVTVSTYQILTHRRRKGEAFTHFGLFAASDWGLIIYDEVHLLPAPVFRATAGIQARRRLGLTATLVREDRREAEVFSLIGPKRYDAPWKTLEVQGWIAAAECTEIRVPLPEDLRMRYALADAREKFRIASENEAKFPVVRRLLRRHQDDLVLVIGQYLDQLARIQEVLRAPLITGKTPTRERQRLYEAFRTGALPILLVSKVGNFAIDLPDANVAIQISGTFGSRQEEAQRLGRILRPKANGTPAFFYSIVTRDTKDQEFADNRQRFLTEQGYAYRITDAQEPGELA